METETGVIVPYTDAMHLGRGFNSYTLEPCLDDCVSGPQASTHERRSVSYRAMIVNKPSDVAHALNIPFYPSIKRGALFFNDAISPIDEAEFFSADINFLLIVNVETQRFSMTVAEGGLRLRDGIQPGSLLFNETYGDSYVSGYIAGGTAAVVLSITVLDRTKVEETVKAIKGTLNLSEHEASVKMILNAYTTPNAFTEALKAKTKSHACVSCIGNGNLITGIVGIGRVLPGVLNFPDTVGTTPDWTWAVLTKYHTNPSLSSTLGSSEYATLKYGQIENFSAELLDNFIGFKALLRDVKAILADQDKFEPRKDDKNPIEISLKALLNVQSKLRQELSKIIEAIDVLSRDPWSHGRQMTKRKWQGPQPANDLATAPSPAAAGTNATDPDDNVNEDSTVGAGAEQLAFDFGSLLSPDIWQRSMPVSKLKTISDTSNTFRVAQSSEAMAREHKRQMDASLGTHSSEVQKVTNELNNVKQALSETESKLQTATTNYQNTNTLYVNTHNDLLNTNRQLSDAQIKLQFVTGRNNLEPACHGRHVLIFLRVYPHTALDYCGAPHGWGFGLRNANQRCFLQKVRPEQQDSKWLMSFENKYLELRGSNNGTALEYYPRRSGDAASWQEWEIGRISEEGVSYRIYNPYWNLWIDMADCRADKEPKTLAGWRSDLNPCQLFQILIL